MLRAQADDGQQRATGGEERDHYEHQVRGSASQTKEEEHLLERIRRGDPWVDRYIL